MTKSRNPAAQRLDRNIERILLDWEEVIREQIEESRKKDQVAIRNSLPELLKKMVETLSRKPPKNPAELESELAIAKEHGRQRAELNGYSIHQVIHEYQLLRQVILRILEEDEPLNPEDRNVVLDAISLGQRIASKAFYENQLVLEAGLRKRTRERDTAAAERDESLGQVSELETERGLRETFVSTLAHDLRTPITAARMNLELMLKKRDEVGAMEVHTGRALMELTRLENLIQNLLDANRIKAGQRLPLRISPIDLISSIQTALDSLTSIYGDRFELDAPPLVEGFWDPRGIERIVENLCTNAIKYGHRSEPVTICVFEGGSGVTVGIAVQNWGEPLSERDQENLFRPFQRGSSARAQGGQGWGLGLTLVRGMAEAHGGSVRVESSRERGTVFTVTLPRDARAFSPGFEEKERRSA